MLSCQFSWCESRSESFLNFCGTVCPPTARNLEAQCRRFSAFSRVATLFSAAFLVRARFESTGNLDAGICQPRPRLAPGGVRPSPWRPRSCSPRRRRRTWTARRCLRCDATRETRADPGSPRRRRREPSRPPPHLPPQRPRRAVRARRGPKRGSSLWRVRAERPTETRSARNGTNHRLTSCPAAPLRIPRTRITLRRKNWSGCQVSFARRGDHAPYPRAGTHSARDHRRAPGCARAGPHRFGKDARVPAPPGARARSE